MIRYDKLDLYPSLIPVTSDESYVLGRKFASNIRTLDSRKINNLRLKIEDIKLQVIDAAENGLKPPRIENTQWLYELYFVKTEYKFITHEFEDWLMKNALHASFVGNSYDRSLQISVNTSRVDIGTSKDLPDTSGLVIKALKKRSGLDDFEY